MTCEVTTHKGANLLGQALRSEQTLNAEKHGMNGCVTPRAITYAAAQARNSLSLHPAHAPQLHFALVDTTHWMSHYNRFDYEEF